MPIIIDNLKLNDSQKQEGIPCKAESNVQFKNIRQLNGSVSWEGSRLFTLKTEDAQIEFSIMDKNKERRVIRLFETHQCALGKVWNNPTPENNVFTLNMAFFNNALKIKKLSIQVPEDLKISKQLKKRFDWKPESPQSFFEKLNDSIILNDGVGSAFACEFKGDGASEFSIYGNDVALRLKYEQKGVIEQVLLKRITGYKKVEQNLTLLKGEIVYNDPDALIPEMLFDSLKGDGEYNALWGMYVEESGLKLLEKARSVGYIDLDFKKTEFGLSNGSVRIPFKNTRKDLPELIKPNDKLLFSPEEIPYIEDKNMGWTQYARLSKPKESASFRVVSIEENCVVLEGITNAFCEKDYFVTLSIIGDEKQVKRQLDVRERIKTCSLPNPKIIYALEGDEERSIPLNLKTGVKKIAALTDYVKNKIFDTEPTANQKDAIEIALNTPDIAVIQGPPGTGKTTVITAIVERLNEMFEYGVKSGGQLLISSLQHDAVKNITDRLRINGLIVPKFGGQNDEEEDRYVQLEKWCEDKAKEIKDKYGGLRTETAYRTIDALHVAYISRPNENNLKRFLEAAKKEADVDLSEKIDALINELGNKENFNNDSLREHTRGLTLRLRTTKEGFLDDGRSAAEKLKDILIEKYNAKPQYIEPLKRAAETDELTDEELKRLKECKEQLLQILTPPPEYKKDKADPRITEIYNELLSERSAKNPQTKEQIVANLLYHIENNEEYVEKTLEHYTFAFAATAQQSECNAIRSAKGMGKHNEHPVYETVIIDEAARVNPADLLIPLTQARRRIILVGDHRQLPHMYDEEIFNKISSNSGENIDTDLIKISMFERLFLNVKALEKRDGVKRVITLDNQYRMHPVLGDFISKTFYEPHGESFNSPLGSDFAGFKQNLSHVKDFPAEWVHIPVVNKQKDVDKRGSGGSRMREREADYIARKLKDLLDKPESEKLSFGVITFYSEQRDLINKKIKEYGVDKSRVTVGTVDAFQGREFDVVFLSVVRTADVAPKDGDGKPIDEDRLLEARESLDEDRLLEARESLDEDKELDAYRQKAGVRNYGFLISENRLCVALSRQKRLLIVVGDADLFRGAYENTAEACVPGMRRLYKLCEDNGACYEKEY